MWQHDYYHPHFPDRETEAKTGNCTCPRASRITSLINNGLGHCLSKQHPPLASFPGLCCARQWSGCCSWPSGLSWSCSSSAAVDAESMGPSGCLQVSSGSLGPSRLRTAAGRRWARIALASSESQGAQSGREAPCLDTARTHRVRNGWMCCFRG